MILIPLPFVMAMAALLVFAREWVLPSQRHYWLLWFLGVLAFQEFLVGARFGYGMDGLKLIQPISAAALPPLAYLGFARPKLAAPVLIHAIPVVVILLIVFFFTEAMDVFLAANNLYYAAGLALIGLRGSDALAWAAFGRTGVAMAMLWFVVLVLLVSGATDALISYDFLQTRGDNIGSIVGWASVSGLIMTAALFVAVRVYVRRARMPTGNSVQERETYERLQTLMQDEKLFIDPDINLSRIARRMSLPARD